jgi:hypothetical protein
MRTKKIQKSRMKIFVRVVVVKCRTGPTTDHLCPTIWLGSVLWYIVNTYRIVEGKIKEMRHSVRWNRRFREHVEVDVM